GELFEVALYALVSLVVVHWIERRADLVEIAEPLLTPCAHVVVDDPRRRPPKRAQRHGHNQRDECDLPRKDLTDEAARAHQRFAAQNQPRLSSIDHAVRSPEDTG